MKAERRCEDSTLCTHVQSCGHLLSGHSLTPLQPIQVFLPCQQLSTPSRSLCSLPCHAGQCSTFRCWIARKGFSARGPVSQYRPPGAWDCALGPDTRGTGCYRCKMMEAVGRAVQSSRNKAPASTSMRASCTPPRQRGSMHKTLQVNLHGSNTTEVIKQDTLFSTLNKTVYSPHSREGETGGGKTEEGEVGVGGRERVSTRRPSCHAIHDAKNSWPTESCSPVNAILADCHAHSPM